MKKRMIAFLCIALFLLTACTSAPKKSRMVPGGSAEAIGDEASAVSGGAVSGDVVSLKDEQELDALSQSLEDDFNLEEIDEMVDIEI